MKLLLNHKLIGLSALLSSLAIPAWAQQTSDALPTATESSQDLVPGQAESQDNVPLATTRQDPKEITPTQVNPGTRGLPPADVHYDVPTGIDTRTKRTADRLRRILVLRQLLALGFSSGDIANALPLLRDLRNINSAPPADPEKAMEEEYQALLEASPGKPLPPSSAVKITDAARYCREEQAKIWRNMFRKLGTAKAEGLRSILGQDGQDSFDPFLTPMKPTSKARSPYGRKGAPKPEATDPLVPATPEPKVGGAAPGDDTLRLPAVESATPVADSRIVPVGPRTESSAAPEDYGALPGQSPEPQKPDLPTRAQNQAPLAIPRDGAPRTPGQYRSVPAVPGVNRHFGSDYRTPMYDAFTQTTVRISLTELIDLMQEKLNVMNGTRAKGGF